MTWAFDLHPILTGTSYQLLPVPHRQFQVLSTRKVHEGWLRRPRNGELPA